MKTGASVIMTEVVCFPLNTLGERVARDLPGQRFENPQIFNKCKGKLGRLRVLVVVFIKVSD